MPDYSRNHGSTVEEELLRRVADLERQVTGLSGNRLVSLDRLYPPNVPTPVEGQVAVKSTTEEHTWYSNGQWRTATYNPIYLTADHEATMSISSTTVTVDWTKAYTSDVTGFARANSNTFIQVLKPGVVILQIAAYPNSGGQAYENFSWSLLLNWSTTSGLPFSEFLGGLGNGSNIIVQSADGVDATPGAGSPGINIPIGIAKNTTGSIVSTAVFTSVTSTSGFSAQINCPSVNGNFHLVAAQAVLLPFGAAAAPTMTAI